MAEYIDRNELEVDTEWSDYYDDYISYSQLQINNAPAINAIPIPDNATNGDMIKAMFPSLRIANDGLINDNLTGIMAFYGGGDSPLPRGDNYFNRDWWNAPYESED